MRVIRVRRISVEQYNKLVSMGYIIMFVGA